MLSKQWCQFYGRLAQYYHHKRKTKIQRKQFSRWHSFTKIKKGNCPHNKQMITLKLQSLFLICKNCKYSLECLIFCTFHRKMRLVFFHAKILRHYHLFVKMQFYIAILSRCVLLQRSISYHKNSCIPLLHEVMFLWLLFTRSQSEKDYKVEVVPRSCLCNLNSVSPEMQKIQWSSIKKKKRLCSISLSLVNILHDLT